MKKKILSLLTAFAMVFGILVAPFTSAKAADATQGTKSVTLHKILQTKENLAKSNFPGKVGLDNTKYEGNEITGIADYFGQDSEEINGVYFAWQKQFEEDDPNSTTNPKAKIKVWRYINSNGEKATKQDPKEEGFKAAVLGGLTGAQANDETNPLAKGYRFDTSKLAAGQYRIQEIDSLSTYVKTYYFDKQGNELTYNEDNKKYTTKEGTEVQAKDVVVKESTLTGSKAVPVELTLPIANDTGVVENAHVYPKNTEEKPTTNKDFSDQFTNEKKGRDQGVEEETQTNNPTEKTNDQQDHNVGDVINYTVRTTIPANARYASAYWDDNMTEGLTYNKDLSIKLNGKLLVPGVDYELVDKENGFKASLTKALSKINGKDTEQEIVLTYSATLNDTAVSKVPESNDVTFHFGNNPNKGNTPIPTKPNDQGELKVEKSWDNGVWAEGETATFRLVDAQTGKTVTADDLVKPEGMSDEDWTAAKNTFTAEATIGYNQSNKEYTWKYLDKDKQYKAIEINMTTGTESEYVKQADGTIKVVNHKTNNPKSINPTEPKVKTNSKKFVKRDEQSSKRLENAVFVVKNNNQDDPNYGKYLKISDEPVNQTNVDNARKALKEKVDAYNNLTAEQQDGAQGETLIGEIETAQNTLNEAIKANVKYTWVESSNPKDDKAKLTVYTSNTNGQIEVKGLKDGNYTLVEIEAPANYSQTANVKKDFTIGDDSDLVDNYDVAEDAKADAEKAAKDAVRVNNTLVTIPETGGIGSLIFIVAGLAIMAGAFVAYKKSQATA